MVSKKKTKEKQEETLRELEKLAKRFGIRVSYGDMKFAGLKLKSGQCLFKGERWLILDRKQPFEDKVDLFRETLEHLDLSQEELPPDLADLIVSPPLPLKSGGQEA